MPVTVTAFKLDPFIEAKVRLWYRLHNKKRNGFFGSKDCSEVADTFAKEFHLDEKTFQEIRSWLVDGWSTLVECGCSVENGVPLLSADKTPCTLLVAEKMANNGIIDEDMYVKAYSEIIGISQQLFSTCFTKMVELFFDVFDADKDGQITSEDMVRGLRCFGITNDAAVRAVFEDLDVMRVGKIDKETYVNAWLEFMMGHDQDAAMAKHFTPDIL